MDGGGATHKPPARPRAEVRRSDASLRGRLSVSQYVEGIRTGNRSILAKAITLIESLHPADCILAADILEICLKEAGDSIVVGVTGVPGAGKSSLIDALGSHIITNHDEKIAVLTIDPSSRISGGSILGDKVRMPFLALSEMAFIRPSPSRERLGGIAAHTRDVIVLCKAAGYRNVFIETVGVGQSETSVREMVDFLLLVAIAGAGDELQGIKRGVMEMVDAIAVNKADGENAREAEKARAVAEVALHYFSSSGSDWTPLAVLSSARTGLGIAEIWSRIVEHHRTASESGYLARLRREQNLSWLHDNLERGLKQIFMSTSAMQKRLTELEKEVAAGQTNPIAAARQLLSKYDSKRQRRLGKRKHQL
jgi:LAO/AO transport system kinase